MIDENVLEEVQEKDHPKVYGFTREELDKSFRAFRAAVEKDKKYFDKYFSASKMEEMDRLYIQLKEFIKRFKGAK
jgi:hypothetical protein